MADTTVAEQRPEVSSTPIGRKPRRGMARILVLIVLLIALGVGGYKLWQYFSAYESTDDAQIDGHVDAISARITGHVTEVLDVAWSPVGTYIASTGDDGIVQVWDVTTGRQAFGFHN